MQTVSTTVQCLLQNRLGALDRVLAAFTHRGIVPNQILSNKEDDCLQISVSFECDDPCALEKLLKFLQKQVYVLDATETSKPGLTKVTELFTPTEKRRAPHANNA